MYKRFRKTMLTMKTMCRGKADKWCTNEQTLTTYAIPAIFYLDHCEPSNDATKLKNSLWSIVWEVLKFLWLMAIQIVHRRSGTVDERKPCLCRSQLSHYWLKNYQENRDNLPFSNSWSRASRLGVVCLIIFLVVVSPKGN